MAGDRFYELRDLAAKGREDGRSFDHFVNMVGDIETGGTMYAKLGFRVMPVMEHLKIGSSNICIQFDHTYIELIGDIDHSNDSKFKTLFDIWKAGGDYVYWQTSVTSDRLEDESERLAALGYEPEEILEAARRVRKIGGGWDETQSRSRYTLNEDHVTGSIFMSDHPKPEAIWMPGYPVHPNTT
ncbi:MAG: VOC family protein, partial [Pseudomonadota bacterium]